MIAPLESVDRAHWRTAQDTRPTLRTPQDGHGEGTTLTNLGIGLREVRRFNEAITACQYAGASFATPVAATAKADRRADTEPRRTGPPTALQTLKGRDPGWLGVEGEAGLAEESGDEAGASWMRSSWWRIAAASWPGGRFPGLFFSTDQAPSASVLG